MPPPSQTLSGFTRSLWLTSAMFAVALVCFVIYVDAEKQIDHANEVRLRSHRLAGELRQSSDDLTRMVRTFTVTADPRYKRHYEEILAIRDGKSPRPLDYDRIYWDLVVDEPVRPRTYGDATPLLELMRNAGFTDSELAMLASAKLESDALTQTERLAISLIEPHGRTPAEVQVDRTRAIALLNDPAYHRAKAAIMQPINDVEIAVSERTDTMVHRAEQQALLIRWIFIAFALALTYSLWQTYRMLHATLGGPLTVLQNHLTHIGSGNFSEAITVPEGMEASVLADLAKTQRNLATLYDERTRINDELTRHKANLETLVAERTAEAMQAKKEAELANQTKSLFLSNMSHEMRTPMHAIISFARLGLEKAERPEIDKRKLRDYFERIHQGSNRLLTLLNNLLDLSALEANRMALDLADHDLESLFEPLVAGMAAVAGDMGKPMRIDWSGVPPALTVHCDQARIRQVMQNLIANAVKFSPPQSTVRISAQPVSIPGRRTSDRPNPGVRICVDDEGMGIPENELELIFDEFEQSSKTHTGSGGTGLGLAICRHIIALHRCTIQAANRAEGGARLSFTLPATPI